jgi:four helix bundle protein
MARISMVHIVRSRRRMGEESERLKKRTMKFALDVCKMIRLLPYDEPGPTVKRQLAKSSTSLAMNYRSSCRARSHSDFTSKIGLVAEESDESQGWIDFIQAAELIKSADVQRLLTEATEVFAGGTSAHCVRGS